MIQRTTHYCCSLFSKIWRICIASVHGFKFDDCFSKASALTYYTLLSIVPLLAVGFGIAKGFGFEKNLETQLMSTFADQPEVADKLIVFTYKTLDSTRSGIIAFIGLIILFWSVLKLLSNIEASLNTIWKHAKQRSLSRRFTDYLAMILFCPVFFITASSLFAFVISQMTNASHLFQTLGVLDLITSSAILIVPFAISWLLFTAVYYIMPNTKVPFSAALIAGFLAAIAYQIVQWAYIHFQIGVASYGAIYGSFIALPLFLIWINTSWIVALGGAEIAYQIENDFSITEGADRRQIDQRTLGFILFQNCVDAFNSGLVPPTIYQLATTLSIPVDVARDVIQKFLNAGLIVNVNWRNESTTRYQPGKLPSAVQLNEICDALDYAKHRFYYVKYDPKIEEWENQIRNMNH